MKKQIFQRKVMKRKASDNEYLHKDFHLSFNILLDYIYKNFGKKAVEDYLKQYAKAYFRPLIQKLKRGQLKELRDYFIGIYKKEKWPIKIIYKENHLELEQRSCPGISYIKLKGKKPSACYKETYSTVYKTICDNTPYEYKLEFYNKRTGACKQVFSKKKGEK